jgi:hypothetical protein
MTIRRRKTSHAPAPVDSDFQSDPQSAEEAAPTLLAEQTLQKRFNSFSVRLFYTVLMLVGFLGLLFAGITLNSLITRSFLHHCPDYGYSSSDLS